MNQEFKASLKSADTEEHIDIYFYRPIGYQWARFFRMLHVTPNVVTILSIFLGVGAGICFYFDDLAINILGIFLLIWQTFMIAATVSWHDSPTRRVPWAESSMVLRATSGLSASTLPSLSA